MRRVTRLVLVWAVVGLCAAHAGWAAEEEIACGQRVTGTLDSTDPTDTWTFTGQIGQRVLIDADETSNGPALRVLLDPPKGADIPADAGGFIDHKLESKGQYRIIVEGEAGTGYELHYVNLQGCSWDKLTCGAPRSGEIDSTTDMDVYQLDGEAGDQILIDVDAMTQKFVPRVSVYPPDGGDYEKDANESVDFTLGRSGTYTIIVYGENNATGKYELSYTNLDRCGGEMTSCTQSGEFTSTADMDVYRIEVLAGQMVWIDLDGQVGSTGDAVVCMDVYLPGEDVPRYREMEPQAEPLWLNRAGTYTMVVYARDLSRGRRGWYALTLTGDRTLTVTAATGGSVIPQGSGNYSCGTRVPVEARADENYEFKEWTGTAVDAGKVEPGSEPNVVTVTVDGNHTLQAHFVLAKRILTVLSAEGGSVQTEPEGPYRHGDRVAVTAKPDAYYRFTGWTGTAVQAGAVDDPGNTATTVAMNADYTLQANFALVEHTLTTSWSGPGSVTSPSEQSARYKHGTAVSLVAAPEPNRPCVIFIGWTGTAVEAGKVADPVSLSTTMLLDADYTLHANFALRPYTLTILPGAGGSVAVPGEGQFVYDCGSLITVTAVPNRSRCFVGWMGTAVDNGKVADPTSPSTTVLIDGDYTLQPVFTLCTVKPQVSTEAFEDVTRASAVLLGKLALDGNDVSECWFRYWTEGREFETPKVSGKRSGESFSQTVTGLRCGTTYYYQARARNSAGYAEGEVRSFTTHPPSVWLTVSSNSGGTVVEPGVGVFSFCEPNEMTVLAQPTEPDSYFWCWTGSAVDAGKISGDDVGRPDTRVFVDANDTLHAMFLRTIPKWEDDVDRPARRGVAFSTSQLWDFGDRAGDVKGFPPGLYDVTGAAPNGQPPLPGTALAPVDQVTLTSRQWWPIDPFTGSDRKGLLAVSGLHASIHVWQSQATATSVWVQVIWRPYDDAETDIFLPDASPELALADIDPPRLAFRMLAEEFLPYGWRRSTYAWDVAPSPIRVGFTLSGRVVIDSLIVDTYTEDPVRRNEIHVDDDARHDPGPNDTTISNPSEDGTPERPFDSLREALDAAQPGTTIVVHEGRYGETIDVSVRDITITASWLIDPGVRAPSILDAGGSGPAVRLIGRPGASCTLSGLTIVGGNDPSCTAILCQGGSPTVSHCILCGNTATADGGAIVVCKNSRARFINCTMTGNSGSPDSTLFSLDNSDIILLSSIIWGNDELALGIDPGFGSTITYSDIEGGWPGLGVLNLDPGLSGPTCGSDGPIKDSIGIHCIDAGDPKSIWDREPAPNGGRVNLGAYGGTEKTARSAP